MSTAIDISTLVVCTKPVEGGPALWEAEFLSLKLPFGINQDWSVEEILNEIPYSLSQ
ncbi:MAG: hypothetical protein U7126_16460 [Microcoleus sp.]